MLAHLFDAELVYRSEMEPLTRDGEGELIGSGDGTVVGDAIAGALAWTLFEQPGNLVCAMNPVAVIETDDGARVRLEARGFARRSDEASRVWAVAATLGLDAADALRVLAREDLVHVDANGRPVVAYPFSATPRGHRVLIDGKRWVEAMCAIDALGIAPMLGLPTE